MFLMDVRVTPGLDPQAAHDDPGLLAITVPT
jgi:hypothetical protein